MPHADQKTQDKTGTQKVREKKRKGKTPTRKEEEQREE